MQEQQKRSSSSSGGREEEAHQFDDDVGAEGGERAGHLQAHRPSGGNILLAQSAPAPCTSDPLQTLSISSARVVPFSSTTGIAMGMSVTRIAPAASGEGETHNVRPSRQQHASRGGTAPVATSSQAKTFSRKGCVRGSSKTAEASSRLPRRKSAGGARGWRRRQRPGGQQRR